MWGGIYALLFSISTILSVEDPIKNGFVEKPAKSYTKYSLSNVEFQNEIVGKEIQYSFFMKIRDLGLFKRGNRYP